MFVFASKHINLDIFLDQLVPLDLILLECNSPFAELIQISSKISRGNGSFAHCCLVINKDICPSLRISGEESNKLFLLESTVSISEKTKDSETDALTFGTTVRDARKLLQEFIDNDYSVAKCSLKENPFINGADEEKERIRHIVSKVHTYYCITHKSLYELNVFALLATIFPTVRPLRNNVDRFFSFVKQKHPWLFCSELICIIYRDLGLLDKDIDVEDFVPVDFINCTRKNKVNSIMKLPPQYLYRRRKTSVFYDFFRWLCKSEKKAEPYVLLKCAGKPAGGSGANGLMLADVNTDECIADRLMLANADDSGANGLMLANADDSGANGPMLADANADERGG